MYNLAPDYRSASAVAVVVMVVVIMVQESTTAGLAGYMRKSLAGWPIIIQMMCSHMKTSPQPGTRTRVDAEDFLATKMACRRGVRVKYYRTRPSCSLVVSARRRIHQRPN